ERRGRTIRQRNGEFDVEIACCSSCCEWQVEHVSGDPQSLEIRYRSTGREMSPRLGRIVSDHACQLCCDFQLEARCDWRRLDRNVVRVVEHGCEKANLRGDCLLREHVRAISPAEERDSSFELCEESHQLLRQRRYGVLVPGLALVGLANCEAIFRMIVAPPEYMIAQRLHDHALQQVGVLGARAQEPCAKRFMGFRRSRCGNVSRRHAAAVCDTYASTAQK